MDLLDACLQFVWPYSRNNLWGGFSLCSIQYFEYILLLVHFSIGFGNISVQRCCLEIVSAPQCVHLTWLSVYRNYFPETYHIVQEMQYFRNIERKMRRKSAKLLD